MNMKRNYLIVAILLMLALLIIEIIILVRFNTVIDVNKYGLLKCWMTQSNDNESSKNFTNFDNELGSENGCYIVPNIVHFIRFSKTPFTYLQMICYLSAFVHQRPDRIYIHYDDNATFSGKYWNILQNTPGFMDITELRYLEKPTEIFGRVIGHVFHASDVARIRVLLTHGGIFLDNDSYIVRSLNDLRRYEMTLGWDDGEFLGTQVLVAHKDSRFLRMWFDSYQAYNSSLWYFNAGELPTYGILEKKPELVHRMKHLFGVHLRFTKHLYTMYWPEWRYMYTFHLLANHFYLLGKLQKKIPEVWDEENIMKYAITFREMALDVYNPDNVTLTYVEGPVLEKM